MGAIVWTTGGHWKFADYNYSTYAQKVEAGTRREMVAALRKARGRIRRSVWREARSGMFEDGSAFVSLVRVDDGHTSRVLRVYRCTGILCGECHRNNAARRAAKTRECPNCRVPLRQLTAAELICPQCVEQYRAEDWPPARPCPACGAPMVARPIILTTQLGAAPAVDGAPARELRCSACSHAEPWPDASDPLTGLPPL